MAFTHIIIHNFPEVFHLHFLKILHYSGFQFMFLNTYLFFFFFLVLTESLIGVSFGINSSI